MVAQQCATLQGHGWSFASPHQPASPRAGALLTEGTHEMYRHRYRSRRLWERRLALFFTSLFAWTFILAPGVTALAQRQVPSAQHLNSGFRLLSTAEMSKIRGAVSGHALSYSATAGAAYPWEGGSGGVNTGDGNKLTSINLVQWIQRGGLPVSFSLAHNSEGNHNSELGQKWTFSYDIYLMTTGSGGGIGNLAVHWGDDQSYIFTNNGSNVFTAPTGIHDKLVLNIDSTLTLTRPDQTAYHFTGGYCDTITDEKLELHYNRS